MSDGIFICPPPPIQRLDLQCSLDVGFGMVTAYHRVSKAQRWSAVYHYMRRSGDRGRSPTMRKIEAMAKKEGGEWRVKFDTPLRDDTYERRADGWVHIKRGMGFA